LKRCAFEDPLEIWALILSLSARQRVSILSYLKKMSKEDVEFVEGRQGLAPDQWRMLLELTDQWAVILQVEAAVARFGLVFFLLFSNA